MPFRPLWVDAEEAIRSKESDGGYDERVARFCDWAERYAAERDVHRRLQLEIEFKFIKLGWLPLWRG